MTGFYVSLLVVLIKGGEALVTWFWSLRISVCFVVGDNVYIHVNK
jgi:hypothetical protein